MRNTCDSSKADEISAASARAEARSRPNGFSIMSRVGGSAPAPSPAAASALAIAPKKLAETAR